jgi:hypothetical protein
MSISIGASSQLNNYYKPQNAGSMDTAPSKNSAIKDKADQDAVCETCKQRKYQDKSDDPGVSFKSPGHISAGASASVVASHEQEHVSSEQAKARDEGRKVVSQSVVLHYAVCPECHKSYVSGGKTRTVTAADNKQQSSEIGNLLDVKV